ncbi:MAG TPA: HypC/HybG/HupF family hydrogenase formation chaperone [Polyangia bacterium]|nr:HypC/HybG/HupF family hydrogenase formation chaperone [Polyangia bacterium]
MCLAVPMVIVELRDDGGAVAEVGGTRCDIDVSLVEAPALGDHVIVHAGFAIERLDVAEAEARLELFREMSRTVPGAGTQAP